MDALRAIVGEDNASFSIEERLCYAYDATNKDFMPDAVLFPATAGEISEVFKLANERNFPVIARGAGSGFTGGSVPVEGGVVISTERMNRIIEIDTENMTASVEPGVVNGELQTAVEAEGALLPSRSVELEVFDDRRKYSRVRRRSEGRKVRCYEGLRPGARSSLADRRDN